MTIDLIIVALFVAVNLIVGLRFSGRQKTTEAYFVARHAIPGWAMGVSLCATLISSVTFIAYPAAGFEGKWVLFTPGLVLPVLLIPVSCILIPAYRQIIGISAYEYFGKRFGRSVRLYSSFAFSLNHFAKMGFVFYLVALTISSMSGCSVYAVIILLGLATVLYTLAGGVEAVIWTDVIQGITLWLGVLVALGFVLFLPQGGPLRVLHVAWENRMFDFGSAEADLASPTLLVLLTYGLFAHTQRYAVDQTVVQRYLVARSNREAVGGVVLGTALAIPCWALFTLIGTCLWSYYEITGETLPSHIVKSEQVFPYFISTHIPTGLSGLILAALVAAAMSTLSSDLNGLAAVGVEDYYRLIKRNSTDRQRLWVGKAIVAVCGLLCVLIALRLVESQDTALALWYTIASIVSAGLVGLFLLGFLSSRANRQGAAVGIVASIVFAVWATLTIGEGNAFDLGFLDRPLHAYLIGVIGHGVLLGVGYAASWLFRSDAPHQEPLTLWQWMENARAPEKEEHTNR